MSKDEFSKEVLYGRKKAAQYLGVADGTLAVWACTGRYPLPYVKMGRLVKYRKSDLDDFISSRVIHFAQHD